MSLPTNLPGCGEPAITVFEIFTRTGTAYSLDGRLNVCGAHVAPALTALRAADFEPHQATSGKEPGRCGDGYDYVARKPLSAPVVEPPAVAPASDVNRAEVALRMFSALFHDLPDADRAEVLRRMTQPPAHAFKVSRAYPAGFMWMCICGKPIFQKHEETAASIHARLLAHVNGEDGHVMCPASCGRLTGKCAWCPEVPR